jgi:hypothetical protein
VFTNPTGWDGVKKYYSRTFMLLSWWCPLGHGKWHLPAIQFILTVRLIPILTHLSSRWTVPLMAKCAVRRTLFWLCLWFYIIQGLTNTPWKRSISMAKSGINFFDCHPSFLLVKVAMNAPLVCKSRKNCLTGFDQCAIKLSKRIYDSKIGKWKKYIFTVRNKFSLPTSKLVA